MADVLTVHVSIVAAQIERLRAIYPELEDDAELLADMIEGTTNFDNVLDRVTMAFLGKVALKQANAELQKTLQERGARFDRGAEALKELIFALLIAAGKRNAVLPAATLSIAKGRNRLVIDDLDAIPQGYAKFEKIAAKADIAAALATGDQIPGAHLEPSPEHLTVRTK